MNTHKISFPFLLVLLLSNVCLSQNMILKGKVLGDKGEKLEYVNIGIKGKNVGTVSDETGDFSIRLSENNKSDSLSFSYLGYKKLSYKISKIVNENISEFVLIEKPSPLKEVTIISKKEKEKKLGTKSYLDFVVGYVSVDNNQNNNIQEFAKELKIKKPSRILDLNIPLFNVNIDTAKFRVNFYSIKDDLPFEKIGDKNIIIQKKIKNGWNTFDLKKFDLKFQKPVFISIEYLPEEFNEQEPFRYKGRIFGRSIKRSSSLGNWNVKEGVTIAMYVKVRQ